MDNKNIKLRDLTLPYDLKNLSISQCNDLCYEIRDILIKTISKNGGHLSSNLGTVELTMAIHRVFDSPDDKIIWDVGHQCYTHKILTGRLDKFDTIRTENGISGFPKPEESEHDIFISGHSSTSISVAYGIAESMYLKGDNKHFAVAVIGDGAMTGGLAYEGLNNAGKSGKNLIVILNDNAMSISKNVGALSKYLRSIRSQEGYVKAKQHVERRLLKIPKIGLPIAKVLKKIKDFFKSLFIYRDITLFENLGFVYLGPVDGHNLKSLEEALKAAKTYHCPVLVHVNSVKGKGYLPAEENPGEYHGVSKFDIMTGNPEVSSSDSYSCEFGRYLLELAKKDSRICAITAAMKYGTGLQDFAKAYPKRFFDVGIAEQHAVTFSAGLASQGHIPVFAVYSSFLQRAYDQLIHDVSISGVHVVIGIDRAGVVGQDGETHQGMFDVSLIADIPGSVIYSPSSYEELRLCMRSAIYQDNGLSCVRYPRGSEDVRIDDDFISDNYSILCKKNSTILVITYGRIFNNALEAVNSLIEKNIDVDILKLTKIFPYTKKISEISKKYKHIIFFEEAFRYGGIGNMVGETLSENGFNGKYHLICADTFLKQASVPSILDKIGLSVLKMIQYIEKVYENDKN